MNRLSLQEDIQPLSEFRSHVASYIDRVRGKRRPLVITLRGKSAAILMDVAQYEDLLEELELLRDIQTAERQVEAGLGISQEEAKKRVLKSFRK